MLDKFMQRARAAGAEVHSFHTADEALKFITDFLHTEGVADTPGNYAVWEDYQFPHIVSRENLASQVPGLKFAATAENTAAARIGISRMDWGIADSGTLVQDSAAVAQRLVSSLPLIHIALLSKEKIVSDLPELMTKINPAKSSYISFITGPSRTADIERVLAIGVHGPERVLVLCIDDVKGAD